MITINLLPPVDSSSKEYQFEHNDAIISPVVLSDLLGQIETDLDDLCGAVIEDGSFVCRSEKMLVLCDGKRERPHLSSKIEDKYNLGPKLSSGGSSDKGYKNLNGLKARYKQLFRAAKENFRKCGPEYPTVDIFVQLSFFKNARPEET